MKRKQQILAGSLVLAVFGVSAVALATGSLTIGSAGATDSSAQTRQVLSEAQKQADGRSSSGLVERLAQPGSTSTAQATPPAATPGATTGATPTATPGAQPGSLAPPVQVTQTTEAPSPPTITPGAGAAPAATPAVETAQTPAFVPTSGAMPALGPIKRQSRQVVLRSVASADMCR